MREVLYKTNFENIKVPLEMTFTAYSSTYIIKPNLVINGMFGPVKSYIITPDLSMMSRLRVGCINISII